MKTSKPIEITVPHLSSTRTFAHPVVGPDTYRNLQAEIEQSGLVPPTMSETASLLDRVFDRENSDYASTEVKAIRKRIRDGGITAFTGILWTPEGVYMQDHPEIREGGLYMDHENLKSRMAEEDPSVRFVSYPQSHKSFTEERSATMSENRYLIALAGEEGAEKLERISKAYQMNPQLFMFSCFEEVTFPPTRTPSLRFPRVSACPNVRPLQISLGERPSDLVSAFGCKK
jgi:hypothetical protein